MSHVWTWPAGICPKMQGIGIIQAISKAVAPDAHTEVNKDTADDNKHRL